VKIDFCSHEYACSSGTIVFDNIRFVQMLWGFLWQNGIIQVQSCASCKWWSINDATLLLCGSWVLCSMLVVNMCSLFTFQGDLVYANYGEEKDFKLLSTKGVPCRDKIVILRYGRIFPGQMVKLLIISLHLCFITDMKWVFCDITCHNTDTYMYIFYTTYSTF